MRRLTFLAGFALAALLMFAPTRSSAQVSIGIGIGRPAPVCSYGYYGFAPYRCAPYGYYGREWFDGGTFIGAGPWYGGHRGFYGPVNRRYDPRYGYRGGYPARGGVYREPEDHWNSFHGNAYHDHLGHGRPGGYYHHRLNDIRQ